MKSLWTLLTATVLIINTNKGTAQSSGKKSLMLDGIIAVVGSNIILQSDIESQYTEYMRQGYKTDENLRCKILNDLLVQKLLIAQAKIDSITADPSEVENTINQRIQYFTAQIGSIEALEKQLLGKSVLQFKEDIRPQIREQILANKMRAKITSNITVTPSEVKDFFDKTPQDSLPVFGQEVEAGQIIHFPVYSKKQRQDAKNRLEDLRARVKSGEDFGILAALYSQDPGSARNNGELGPFSRGTMVGAFEAVAFKLKPGEVSPVVETKFGFHILQCIYRKGDQVNVRHILIRPEFTVKELEEAKLKMDSVLTNLREGKLTFSEAAILYSDDTKTKSNGGMFQDPATGSPRIDIQMLPSIASEGQLTDEEIVRVLDTLKSGTYSQPLPYNSLTENKQGFRIIYLKSQISAHRANLEEDYPKIRQTALQKKNQEIINDWIKNKKEDLYIKINVRYSECKELTNGIFSNNKQINN